MAQSEDQIWYNPIPEEEEEPQSRGTSLGPGLGPGPDQQETPLKEDKTETEPKSSLETKDTALEVTG